MLNNSSFQIIRSTCIKFFYRIYQNINKIHEVVDPVQSFGAITNKFSGARKSGCAKTNSELCAKTLNGVEMAGVEPASGIIPETILQI